MSPITWAFMFVFGALFATTFFLKSTFPMPEPGSLPEAEYDATCFKVWILHKLIYCGVFLVGTLGIQHNGKSFVDDASRLNL